MENMNSPSVAVITRTKDRPVFLKRAIRSVLDQSFTDWVHVIVNDGGNPATVDLLVAMESEAYAGRVRVVHHASGRGMQNASNSGLEAIDSTFAIIHDDDDSWYPDFLATAVGFLEKEGPDSTVQGVVTQTTQVLEEVCVTGEVKRIRELPYYPFTHVDIGEMRERNIFPPIAFLYRRSVHQEIGYFRQQFDVLGDHDFNLRFLRHFDIGVIHTFHAYYHWRHGSLGNTVTRARGTHRDMLNRMKNAYYREAMNNPERAVGSLDAIPMPPPDGTEGVPFRYREGDARPPAPMPDFLNEFDFKVLSLDVFDTVLRRRCHRPVDVFRILEQRARETGQLPDILVALARMEAESRARKTIRPEVTLEEIYQTFGTVCGLSPDQTRALMELELSVEREMLYADPRWLETYDSCRKNGVRVVFVSDMYLSSATIRDLLAGCGFEDAEVFVSCEVKYAKHDGRLQPLVAEALGVNPGDILHVGDNFHSDVIRTLQAGWQAYHWSPRFNYVPWFAQVEPYYYAEEDLLSTRIMAEVGRLGQQAGETGLTERLGREVAGPLYLSFLNWVLSEARADKVRKLILLGRDGYYWEKALRIMAGKQDLQVEFAYIHSSRKVLNFASFHTLDEAALEFLLTPNPSLTVRDYVNRTGLDAGSCTREMVQVGFADPEETLTNPAGGKYLKNHYAEQLRHLFMLLKPRLEDKFDRDRAGVKSLLDEAGYDPSDCAVVDIGWNASCTKALARLHQSGNDCPIRGYFFGTWKQAGEGNLPVSLKSFFVHLGKPLENADLLKESINWIESLNAAPYATLVTFDEVDGRLEPRFSGEMRGGFSMDQQAELWKGATGLIEAVTDFPLVNYGRHPGFNYLQLVLRRILREPTPAEAAAWGGLLHSEGYGIVSYTPLIVSIGEDTYGEELMRAYWSSNWRRGFLALLPEDKRQFVIERARPARPRTVDELQADLQWRKRQVDDFWNEKEGYKEDIANLKQANEALSRELEKLKTDHLWKSGEADALAREKAALQDKVEALQRELARLEKA